MGTTKTLVEITHDTGYGDDLLYHLNVALRGKDMLGTGIAHSDRATEARQIKALDENETISQAIQSALDCETLTEAVEYVCLWDEYRRSGTSKGEPCFGFVVSELLKIHGIDINKIRIA